MLIISWMRGVVGPDETLRASSLIVLTILLSSVDCTATKSSVFLKTLPGEAEQERCEYGHRVYHGDRYRCLVHITHL